MELDARGAGQVGEDVHERTLLDLDEEGDDITFFAAAEAVEDWRGSWTWNEGVFSLWKGKALSNCPFPPA